MTCFASHILYISLDKTTHEATVEATPGGNYRDSCSDEESMRRSSQWTGRSGPMMTSAWDPRSRTDTRCLCFCAPSLGCERHQRAAQAVLIRELDETKSRSFSVMQPLNYSSLVRTGITEFAEMLQRLAMSGLFSRSAAYKGASEARLYAGARRRDKTTAGRVGG